MSMTWPKFRDAHQGMPPSFPKGHRDVKPLTAEERRLAASADNRQDQIKIAVPEWMDEAACAQLGNEGLADLAFPRTRDAAVDFSRKYCRACPVKEACLQYARDNGEQTGVWGGELFGFNRPCVDRDARGVPWDELKACLQHHELFYTARKALIAAVAEDLGINVNAVERAVRRHDYRFAA